MIFLGFSEFGTQIKDRQNTVSSAFIKGKLQLTHLWFGRNFNCLPMV